MGARASICVKRSLGHFTSCAAWEFIKVDCAPVSLHISLKRVNPGAASWNYSCPQCDKLLQSCAVRTLC